MKKQIYRTLISLIIFVQNLFGQSTIPGNLWGGAPNQYLGWDNASNTPLNIKTELATPINFYTGATGPGGFNNMRMRIVGNYNSTGGLLGMGDMGTGTAPFTPQQLLHLHRDVPNLYQQFTNSNTGITSRDGYLIGLNFINSTFPPFLNIYTADAQHIQQEADPIEFFTNTQLGAYSGNYLNGIRLRITDTKNVAGTQVTRIGIPYTRESWYGKTALADLTVPVSLVHMGGAWQPGLGGHRTWMEVGTYTCWQTDMMYYGLKNESPPGYDDNDAVIGWGDNDLQSVTDRGNVLRFIFTGVPGLGEASNFDGLETARINYDGMFGIGNFSSPVAGNGSGLAPARKLEIYDQHQLIGPDGALPDAPQLRLTYLPDADITNGTWTDMQTTLIGDLYIHPSNRRNDRRVGINTSTPQNTLEINALDPDGTPPYIVPGSSGLRFNDLTDASTIQTNDKKVVLSVNNSGDVILVKDDGGGNLSACSSILPLNFITKVTGPNTICESAIWENPSSDRSVGIGTTSPAAKLNVKVIATGNTSAVIGQFEYSNANSTATLNAIGVYANSNIASGNSNSGFKSIPNGGNYCYGYTAFVNNTNTATSLNYGFQATVYCNSGAGSASKNYGLNTQMTVYGDNTYNYGVHTTVGNTTFHPLTNCGGYFKAEDSELNYGVFAESFSNTINSSTAKYYGVKASAGGNTVAANGPLESFGGWFKAQYGTGLNYGVYATNSNTGTCASAACIQAAGFFDGPICATANSYVPSDAALKTNVNDLTNADFILSQLHPKTYYYDTVQYHMNLSSGLQFGLIAQELALVLPQFTRQFAQPEEKDTLGNIIHPQENFTGISYEPLITLLIAGYQQQKQQIDSLITALNNPLLPKNQNNNTPQKAGVIDVKLTNSENSILYQNEPNPYTSSTTIRYFIPENVSDVKITFQDATGKTLKEVKVNETGQGSIDVDGSELISGTYTYSLVVSGKVIDTKKMVKVK